MPGRKYNSAEYRYGFNGKEKDDEGEFGSITNYDYGFRIYNPATARFLSMDPLSYSYPELTPYQFASNTPIWAADLDGLEAEFRTDGTIWYKVMKDDGFTQIVNELYTSGVAIEWTVLRDQNPESACQITGCEKDDPGNRQYNENPNLFEGQYLYVGLYDDVSNPGVIISDPAPDGSGSSPSGQDVVATQQAMTRSLSYGAAVGVGVSFELGKAYDNYGNSSWFFRAAGEFGFGGGLEFSEQLLTPRFADKPIFIDQINGDDVEYGFSALNVGVLWGGNQSTERKGFSRFTYYGDEYYIGGVGLGNPFKKEDFLGGKPKKLKIGLEGGVSIGTTKLFSTNIVNDPRSSSSEEPKPKPEG